MPLALARISTLLIWSLGRSVDAARFSVLGLVADQVASTVDVPLYWQRWNLSSALLDAVSAAVRAEAGRTLRPLAA